MRIRLVTGWLVIAAATWPLAVSAAQSEFERDQKSAKKCAIASWSDEIWDARGRGLCACLSHPAAPEFEGKLGFLYVRREIETISIDYDMIAVKCVPFAYDRTTGERELMAFCENWVPLAK